jgi:hypothetical protein
VYHRTAPRLNRATDDRRIVPGNEQTLTEVSAPEKPVTEHDANLREVRDELDRLRAEVGQLKGIIADLVAKNVTTCKKCGATYDVFTHHYSIGLFDNIVYVKCPQCQTPMPVDPHHGVRKD